MPKKKNETEEVVVEETTEQTPTVKKKRKIKLSSEGLVDEVQKRGNLPVVDDPDQKFMEVPPAPIPETRKDIKKRVHLTRTQLQEAVLDSNSAAYIQVMDDKHGQRKVIRYKSNPQEGLSSELVEYRIEEGLTNGKPKKGTKSVFSIIFGNVFTFFNILNYAIAGWLISVLGWGAWKYLLFAVIVTCNLIISTVQELRSKVVMDRMSILSSPKANVLRDKYTYEIPVEDIVLDDVLCLKTGDQIVSDSILLEGSIEVNESLLTGESDAIIKKPGDVLYSGSFVVSGNAKARVDRIGKDNYIEKLTGQAQKYKKPSSDILKTLNILIKVIGIVIIPLGVAVFVRQWDFNGLPELNITNFKEFINAYNSGIATESGIAVVTKTAGAIIGMIPSGLYLLTSVALAVGVIRLSQNHTLVQDLYCIEMLARVDVLCLDKTGTITDGSMSVKQVINLKNPQKLTVEEIVPAMQNILKDENVTSVALDEHFGREKKIKEVTHIPFSSSRKYSAVEFEEYGTYLLGAPEFVLGKNFKSVEKDVTAAAKEGYRVLVVGYTSSKITAGAIDGKVVPVGLIFIEDTIRPDAIETIKYFKDSGVEVKVISGDNPLTVSMISKRAGVPNAERYISLDGLTDKEVIRAARQYTVFGRVSPSQKKILVMTLKELGKTVAMTGDGVNDILALKEADCSIAIASGSQAARNVSHLVLLDSNFGSMPKVVAEGRRVINNIQKVASVFLTKTIFSFLLAIFCCVFCKYPIATNQLILIDLFVTGIPSFILALESNNNLVKGRFLGNVLKNALPGAITVVVTTLIVLSMESMTGAVFDKTTNAEILGYLFSKSSELLSEVNTVIVINVTFACFCVLFKVCRPFNTLRKCMFAAMVTFALLIALFIPNILNIYQLLPFHLSFLPQTYPMLSTQARILLICLMLATYPMMVIFTNFIPFIKNTIKNIAVLLSKNMKG